MELKSRYLVVLFCLLTLVTVPLAAAAANLNFIKIVKPTTTDAWYAGGVYDVEWTCTYVDGKTDKLCPVTVTLRRGQKELAPQNGLNGRLAYTVPYDLFTNFPDVTGSTTSFNLTLRSGNSTSSASRLISKATITFTSPKVDSIWAPGSNMQMTWTYKGYLKPFKLTLAGSAGRQDLGQNVNLGTGGAGSYSANLPFLCPGGPLHEIQALAADGTVIARSETFKILYPVPTVILHDRNGQRLASNASWAAGTPGTIGWGNLRGITVNINLVDASNLDSVYEVVKANVLMSNASMSIPYTPPTGKPNDFYNRMYRIRVVPVDNALKFLSGRSEPFKISQASSSPTIGAVTDKCAQPNSMAGRTYAGKPHCYAHTGDARWDLEVKTTISCDAEGYFCCYPQSGINNTRCGANRGILMNLECDSGAQLIQPYGCYR
jgi:hypothetical protein